jgi:molybdopterin converting factor small subunit
MLIGELNPPGGRGKREIDLPEGTNLEEAIEQIAQLSAALSEKILDPDGAPKKYIVIFVNGKNVTSLARSEIVLRDEDEVFLTPPFGGG